MASERVHVLSKKSYSLNRDTFIFWRSMVPMALSCLLGGLNQKVTPVTGATLHRWFCILNPRIRSLELRPVIIRKIEVLSYAVVPCESAPAITHSETPLPPGDYGLVPVSNGKTRLGAPLSYGRSSCSFKEIKFEVEKKPGGYLAEHAKLYDFPPSFEESVQMRDEKCFISGTLSSEADLGVSWIFPPPWAFELDPWGSLKNFDHTSYIRVSNAGLMRTDLLDLFHDNAFGIDVDDNYRIVTFRNLDSVTLPSHLPKSQSTLDAAPGPEDKFLRDHFLWCLKVHLHGGDIREDYDTGEILNYMEMLGVAGDQMEMVPFSDERWNTLLGREIFEFYMGSRLEGRGGTISENDSGGEGGSGND